MSVNHFITGARGSLPLVLDDEDRLELLAAASRGLGRLLAYCVMDTHVHLVAEEPSAGSGASGFPPPGTSERGLLRLEAALAVYARRFNRRHGRGRAPLLRGPVEAIACPGADELLRLVRYVHANPVKTSPPLAARPIEYRWSSARAFAGLSRAGIVDVERARALLGSLAGRLSRDAPPPATLEAARFPTVTPQEVLAAAAELHGVPPGALTSDRRGGVVASARSLCMRLGAIEGFTSAQLAAALGRSPSQASRFARGEVGEADLRAARTLLREPGLRARLPRAA